MPLNPGLLDLLELGRKHSQEEIEGAGFGKAYRQAKERCKALVDRASAALELLGVRRE